MFMRYHGGGVGHPDLTEVEETEDIEPEEAMDGSHPHDLIGLDDREGESSDTEDEEDGVSDPGESSDEETTNMYETCIYVLYSSLAMVITNFAYSKRPLTKLSTLENPPRCP